MDGYGGEGGREAGSGRGGGDRSVSVQDEKPKQVSTSQTDRQNTLRMAAGVTSSFIRHSTAEDKERLSVGQGVLLHTGDVTWTLTSNVKATFSIPYFKE